VRIRFCTWVRGNQSGTQPWFVLRPPACKLSARAVTQVDCRPRSTMTRSKLRVSQAAWRAFRRGPPPLARSIAITRLLVAKTHRGPVAQPARPLGGVATQIKSNFVLKLGERNSRIGPTSEAGRQHNHASPNHAHYKQVLLEHHAGLDGLCPRPTSKVGRASPGRGIA